MDAWHTPNIYILYLQTQVAKSLQKSFGEFVLARFHIFEKLKLKMDKKYQKRVRKNKNFPKK